MTRTTSTHQEWLEWIQVQKDSTLAWLVDDDVSHAVSLVTRYLRIPRPLDLVRQALGFRGSLHLEAENLQMALEDFRSAWDLSTGADHERASLEESIALLYQKLDDSARAGKWIASALSTALYDPRAGSGGLVLNYLDINQETPLSETNRDKCRRVLETTWSMLQRDEILDTRDLREAAARVMIAQSSPNPS